MNIETLKNNKWIIFETISGSHAYGTNIATSDKDIRGLFILPMRERLSLFNKIEEVGDDKQDIKYYELRKFFDLAADCNPSIIELLFMPKDCIQICTPAMQKILDNRHLFISKKAYYTHSGYAFAQCKKAKGENKWINNPKTEEPPQREDFCWIIPYDFGRVNRCPCRPISIATYIKDNPNFSLTQYHAAALEHVSNTFRIYYYGKESKGIFRQGNLVCESIPMDDEFSKFFGLLIYNDQEYQKAMLDHKNYWEWVKNRNVHRWISQEKGEIDYDCKNISHCFRLLMSGKSILETGNPIVRFENSQLQLLRDIRAGKFAYKYLMEEVNKEMAILEKLYKTSTLQNSSDRKKIDDLFYEICKEKTLLL